MLYNKLNMIDKPNKPVTPTSSIPLSHDDGLEPFLSAMTGSDVVMTGRKVSGEAYEGRELRNISFVTRAGGVYIIGLDPNVNDVRNFPLVGVTEMTVVGLGVFERPAVLAMVDRALSKTGGGK